MRISGSQSGLFFVPCADSKYCVFSKLRMKLKGPLLEYDRVV